MTESVSIGGEADDAAAIATATSSARAAPDGAPPPVQRMATGEADREGKAAAGIASRGVEGAGGSLPYRSRIEACFGRHDISGVTAHEGPAAVEASRALGAQAYAFGNSVAFGAPPDLHTAAHEAAHVVQQRGGVQRKGGIDQPGDAYERHADAVADAVVAGRSAESLLDPMAGAAGGSRAVQRKPEPGAHDAPASRPVPARGDYLVELTAAGDYVFVFNTFDMHAWSDPAFTALRYYMHQVFPGVGDDVIRSALHDLHVALENTDPVPAADDQDYQVHVKAALHRGVIAWMKAHHPGLAPHAPRLGGTGLRHGDGGGVKDQAHGAKPPSTTATSSAPAASQPQDKASADVEQVRALYERLRKSFPEAVELRSHTVWPAFLSFVADHADELEHLLHGKGRSAPNLDDLRKLLAQFHQHQEVKDGDSSGDLDGHVDGKRGGSTAGAKDSDIRESQLGGSKDGSIYGEVGGDQYGWIRWQPRGQVQLLPKQPTYVTGSAVRAELAWDLSVHPQSGLVLLPNHCEYLWTVRHNGKLIDSEGHSLLANDRHTSLDLGDEPGTYEIEVTATSRHFKTERHRFSSSIVVNAVSEKAFDKAAFDAAEVDGPEVAFSRDAKGALHLKAGQAAQTTHDEIGNLDLTKGGIESLAGQGKVTGSDRDVVVGQIDKQRKALLEIQDKVNDGTPYVVRGTFVSREDSTAMPLRLLMHVLRRNEASGVAHYELILHDTTFGEPTQHPGGSKQRLDNDPPTAVYRQLEGEALANMVDHFHAHNDYPKGTVHLAAQRLTSDAVWETTLDTNNRRKKAMKVLGTVGAIGGIAMLIVPGGSVVSAGLMVITTAAGLGSVALNVEDRLGKDGHVTLDRRLAMDVLQVVAISLPFGTLAKTFSAASALSKGRFLLCMTSLDVAQGFVIAKDVHDQLHLLDASTAVQLAGATSDDQRQHIHAERDRQVAEVIGGAMVNGTFLLVSLGHGIKNVIATTRGGAAFKVREPVRQLARQGRDRMADALGNDTFEHESGRVQLTADERRYLEHEIATPDATGKPADGAGQHDAHDAMKATEHDPNGSDGGKHSEHGKETRKDPVAPKSDVADPALVKPEPDHPGVELHNHLLGIPSTKYFVSKVGGGEPRTLFEKIYGVFHDSRHTADLKGESPATRQVVEATRSKLAEMAAAGARTAEKDAYVVEQLDKILGASEETPFDQSYSIRDALIKEYIDPTAPGQKQSYKNFTADVLEILAEDNIKYSEQSVSAKKLTENLAPEDMAAAHKSAAAAGKDSDLRFLAMMNTKTIAAEAPAPPPEGAPKEVMDAYTKRKADYDRTMSQYGKTLTMIDKVLERGDVMGIDIAGPEEGKFTAEGVHRFLEMYDHISHAAKARGRELVLRPHVGEGYAGPGAEDAAHVEVARANLETLLRGLEKMGYSAAKGKADGVIVRFGHATHATPEQILRMKALGIIAEANIGSNLATGSISSLEGHPLLYNLYFDEPTILSTDGHGVMRTDLTREYENAESIIDAFKAAQTTITIDGVVKRYENPKDPSNSQKDPHFLTSDKKDLFSIEKLKAWATEYGDRIKAGDASEAAKKAGRHAGPGA